MSSCTGHPYSTAPKTDSRLPVVIRPLFVLKRSFSAEIHLLLTTLAGVVNPRRWLDLHWAATYSEHEQNVIDRVGIWYAE